MTAPLETWRATVPPEWIDYNGHMMDGHYLVAFSYATEAFLDHLGIGPAYRTVTGCTIYTAEVHLNFLREVKAGEELRYETRILGHDRKRIHAFHEMIRVADGTRAATNELMFLHVDQRIMKVVPFPEQQHRDIDRLWQVHATLTPPPEAGRRIALGR